MLGKLVHQDLVFLDLNSNNREDLFKQVGDKLLSLGYVNEGYFNGVMTREDNYPTGLITQNGNIGLPHSDPEYIEKAFVTIVTTNSPIKVKQMGDSQELETNRFYFLGIKDPKGQVGLLSELMALYMDEDKVSELNKLTDPQDIYKFFEALG